jgi:hypothetical protein
VLTVALLLRTLLSAAALFYEAAGCALLEAVRSGHQGRRTRPTP